MAFHVSHASQWATNKCPSGFACLTAELKDFCAVECYGDGNVHSIKCLHDSCCSYQHPSVKGDLCMCPVRKEIFITYHV